MKVSCKATIFRSYIDVAGLMSVAISCLNRPAI